MSTVRASGLTKRYESICALENVDLIVAEGEVRGLLGPNGAGKTTLLRLLFGLVSPDAGTLELLGRDGGVPHPSGARHASRLEGVSGFVESPSFYPYLSGRANLEVLAELDHGDARARIDGALRRVELDQRGDDRVSGYSSGMRQRLGIAAALLRQPRLLLLDEPTSGLDPAGVRFVGELLGELSADGVAVLLSSHQISEIEGVCDGFTVLHRGRVAWDGTAEQMRQQAPPSAYRLLTSDDARALAIAADQPGVRAERSPIGGLTVRVQEPALDQFVLALGRAGLAIRRLELTVSSLESMFFALTDQSQREPGLARSTAGAGR
jgi:ABC-2 type transport system ATP-binding protein